MNNYKKSTNRVKIHIPPIDIFKMKPLGFKINKNIREFNLEYI
jgi:hypothetical protein